MVYQSDAKAQLTFMSWPEYLPDALNRYYFDDSAGQGVDVYVLDTGAHLDHPVCSAHSRNVNCEMLTVPVLQEFDLVRGRSRYIHVGEGGDEKDNDCKTHGTSMLSLVAGKTVGVAKNINPIIVRMPCRPHPKNPNVKESMQGSDWIDALGLINDELDGSTPKVVLMASGWTTTQFPGPDGQDQYDGFVLRHKDMLDALAAKGAILVTGAGNAGAARVYVVPAIYGKPGLGSQHVPSLIVAGGVHSDGVSGIKGDSEPAAGVPHVYAPGYEVYSVKDKSLWNSDNNNGILSTSGTSCSAAFTAGLAAYYIRLAQLGQVDSATSSQAIKDLIVRTSWSRKDIFDHPRPGVWNSADVQGSATEWTPNTASRRALFGRKVYA